MLHLAVLASGRGSNMQAILEGIQQGRVQAAIALVLSNNPEAPVVAQAKAAGIPVWAAAHTEFASREAFDAAMLRAMAEAAIEGVILAGYMRLLSPAFIRAFAGRILNIHPALLPAFPGAHGVADTLAYGAKFAGCTVHFVTEDMDAGPVVIQAALPVQEGESEEDLHARIQTLEHRIYPQAVQWLAQGRLEVHGRSVRLLPPTTTKKETAPKGGPAQEFLISPPLEAGF